MQFFKDILCIFLFLKIISHVISSDGDVTSQMKKMSYVTRCPIGFHLKLSWFLLVA